MICDLFPPSLTMWLTPGGARALHGAERSLFASAIDFFVDVDKGNCFECLSADGAEIFSRLAVRDKYLVLRCVSTALLSDSLPPFASAVLESAIHAIYLNYAATWACEEPSEAASLLIDYFMENERFKGGSLDAYLTGSLSPTRDEVFRAITARVEAGGAEEIAEELVDHILLDRGAHRSHPVSTDPKYWSEGAVQLKALRRESKAKGETFAFVYWDLKASFLTTGFPKVWSAGRKLALKLEKDTPAAIAYPSLKKHINGELTRHVETLFQKIARAYVVAKARRRAAAVAGASAPASSAAIETAGHAVTAPSPDQAIDSEHERADLPVVGFKRPRSPTL